MARAFAQRFLSRAAPALRLVRALTGVDPILILSNLRRLLEAGARVILRCPLVPGLNATAAHDDAIADLQSSFPNLSVERLPYHSWGETKYDDLGRPRPQISVPITA